MPVAPSAVAYAEVEQYTDGGDGEKLVPWNSRIWNPVDSVEVLSMLPEPTTGAGGVGGGAAAGTHSCVALEMS